MLGIEGLMRGTKKKDSGTPLGFRESRRGDMATRNHNTKEKVMGAKREGLRKVKKGNGRETRRALRVGAAGDIGKSAGLRFSLLDLALNCALPLSVALPQLIHVSESQFLTYKILNEVGY